MIRFVLISALHLDMQTESEYIVCEGNREYWIGCTFDGMKEPITKPLCAVYPFCAIATPTSKRFMLNETRDK